MTAEIKGEVARWVLLSAHYRQSVDWTPESVTQAEKTLDRIYRTLADVSEVPVDESVATDAELLAALDDDLNTPKAFARINQMAKALANTNEPAAQSHWKSALLKSCELLGVLQTAPAEWFADKQSGGEDIKAQVEQLIAERDQARADKNWGRSDEIRDELDAMGVVLEDSPEGTRWSMK